MRVLVVEDERRMAEVLRQALSEEGYAVTVATDGREGLSLAGSEAFDLILLDVMLPDMGGFDVCRRLRADRVRVPVVFLTARDATEDKVTGLTIGGDDYITKPFSLEEVVARVRAVLRRTRGEQEDTSVLRVGDLELDEDTREVRRGGADIELSPTEFKLLRYLMLNANRVLSKAKILDHVWQYDFGGQATVVETYISYLRRKIDIVEPPLIHTVRGVGYSLRVPR